jgi:hypothetical protein
MRPLAGGSTTADSPVDPCGPVARRLGEMEGDEEGLELALAVLLGAGLSGSTEATAGCSGTGTAGEGWADALGNACVVSGQQRPGAQLNMPWQC